MKGLERIPDKVTVRKIAIAMASMDCSLEDMTSKERQILGYLIEARLIVCEKEVTPDGSFKDVLRLGF